MPYLAGLDGLRAFAVLAVLVYHADYRWLPGGFLGVDVFFVLSGYLITALLLTEWDERGRIDLRTFWLRRARRLLPALFVVLAGTLALAALVAPSEVRGLRADTLAALGYATNWWLIFENQSYFEAMGRPSLLQHLWSLAVEEQFYLLWPPVFVLAMRYARRAVPWLLLAGVAASTLLMAARYEAGTDISRLYYGTDTRAAALLLGALLAFGWRPTAGGAWLGPHFALGGPLERLRRAADRRLPVLLDASGIAAIALLAACCYWMNEFRPFLYQGGFLVVAAGTAVAIAAVAHPRARLLPALLGSRVPRWLGTRSYAVYLWHWPLFMVTRPHIDVAMDGLPLFAVRLALTLVLAELSYRFVEAPVRGGALGRAWQRWSERGRSRLGGPGWTFAGAGFAGSAAVAVAIIVSPGVQARPAAALPPGFEATPPPAQAAAVAPPSAATEAPAFHAPPPAGLDPVAAPDDVAEHGATEGATSTAETAGEPPPLMTATQEPASAAISGSASERQPRNAAPPARDLAPGERPSVTAVGDSVMLGAIEALAAAVPGIRVDGELGLQSFAAIQMLRSLRDAGLLGDAVVVHIGTNGIVKPSEFDEMMQVLADVPRVVVVTVKVPRPWEDQNNRMFAASVAQYSNAVLVDWRALSADRGDLFWTDGVHLRPEGAQVYAALIAEHLGLP